MVFVQKSGQKTDFWTKLILGRSIIFRNPLNFRMSQKCDLKVPST